MPPRSREDTDTIGNIGQHTVCWRWYGSDSPNKDQVSVILQTKGGWVNLGVWPRGPIPVAELEARILAKE